MLYLFTNYIIKMTPEAERFNGWAAMLGFVAAVGAYVTTGQIIPGWFQFLITKFFKNIRTISYQWKELFSKALINTAAIILHDKPFY